MHDLKQSYRCPDAYLRHFGREPDSQFISLGNRTGKVNSRIPLWKRIVKKLFLSKP